MCLRLAQVNKCGALVVSRSRDQVMPIPSERACMQQHASLPCYGADSTPCVDTARQCHARLQREGLQEVIDANRSAGDPEACEIPRAELLQREPGLSCDVEGGVLVPREVVVEPWLIPIAYAHAAQQHGADIYTGEHVVAAQHARSSDRAASEPGAEGRRVLEAGAGANSRWVLRCASGRTLQARTVINCAGLFGDDLEQACLGRAAPYAIRPRKGQFLVLDPGPCAPLHVLQPVPTQHSKGVFVWKTVWGTVVVGPTAEDQDSKSDRSVDTQTIDRLYQHAMALYPPLRTARIVGTYSGLRPATEHRDYQIRAVPDKDWISVAGIRSTGLTASPAIAEYVAFLYASMHSSSSPPASLSPFAPEYLDVLQKNVAAATGGTPGSPRAFVAPTVLPPYTPVPLCPPVRHPNAAVPSLEELALDFAARGDGSVEIFGRTWLVTHGLTLMGLESLSRRLLAQGQTA
jgi:glycerol-3-phosphate dehydrogenase